LDLTIQGSDTGTLMSGAIHPKTPRTACSLGPKKERRGRLFGRAKGDLNLKLHAVTGGIERLIRMFPSGGKTSDYIGAAALVGKLS
jgi:hypothetical protein